MKFSTLLKSNKLQGWEDFYIQYNNLIKYLKNDTNRFKSLLLSEFTKITEFFNGIEDQTDEQRNLLFKIVRENFTENQTKNRNKKKYEIIEKINTSSEKKEKLINDELYSNKINKSKSLVERENDLSFGGEESDFENIKIVEDIKSPEKKDNKKRRMLNFDTFKINGPFEKRKKEKAFHELLQAINSVKSYRDINYMGLSIIIRKYINKIGSDEFSSDFLKKLHQSHFRKSKKIDKMQKEVRSVYKKVFVLNDKFKAQIIFKKIGKKLRPDPFLTFLIGVFLTALVVIIYCADLDQNPFVKRIAYNVGLIQFGAFLFGVCDLLFIKYDINHNLIFNFDVISNLSPIDFLLNITLTLNLTFLSCLIFIKKYPDILAYGLVCVPICIIALPFNILWYKSRLYFISVFIGTLVSGFRKVYFKNFFFADVFQSFTSSFKMLSIDLGIKKTCLSFMFFNNLWPTVRIIQCLNRYKETKSSFPHLINMSKYLLTFISGTLQAVSYFYKDYRIQRWKFFFTFCASTFSLIWDYFLDWTIFRSKKLFPNYFYVLGAIYNFGSRYLWICKDFNLIDNEFVFISCEIVRRFVWALFRVENEHVNNCTDEQSKLGLLFSKELFFIKDSTPKIKRKTSIKNYSDPDESL